MKRFISLIRRPLWIGLMIGFSLLLGACSASVATVTAPGVTPAPSAANTQTAPLAPPATSTQAAIPVTGSTAVQVLDNPEFGQVLATSDGLTLYTNTVDTAEDLRCINIACTGFWPPYSVDAEPTAGAEIPGSLGIVNRPDGSKQVTFNQQPLYTFYLDKQQGDAKGNGFTDFGGTWHVVTLGSAPAGSNTETPSTSGGYQY
jgi:predicted lipoprotein with Yx(FWY)xxD motif